MEQYTYTTEQVLQVMEQVVTEAQATHGPHVRYVDVAKAINPNVKVDGTPGNGCFYAITPDSETGEIDLDTDKPQRRVPGCLVGQVLHRLNVPNREVWEVSTSVADAALDEAKVAHLFHPLAIQALDRAQGRQDRGESWAEALKAARG